MYRRVSVLESGSLLLVSTILFVAAAILVPLFMPGYYTDEKTWHAVVALIEIGCFLVPGAVYLLIRRVPPAALSVRRCRAGQIGLAVMMALGGYMVVTFIQLVWLTIIELLGGTPVDTPIPPIDTPFRLLLGFFSIAVSAALSEEFLFRGVVMSGLRSRSAVPALILTALLFMLMHGSVETLPYTFLYGLLLGWLTLRSRSVWPAFAFHLTNNAIPVMMMYAAANLPWLSDYLGSESGSLLAEPAMLAVSLIWYGLIALFCGAGLGVALWAFQKTTPGPEPAAPDPRTRKWHYIPYYASGFIMLCLLALEALEVFGVIAAMQ